MINILTFCVLVYLSFVASYVLWLHLDKAEKRTKNDELHKDKPGKREQGIIGKSMFRLSETPPLKPAGVKTEPLSATDSETEKEEDKEDKFALSKPVGESPEEETEPENPEEENEPLPIDVYLEKEEEGEFEEEDESEEVGGLKGASIAGGLSFEDMGDAVTAVIHREKVTEEECRRAGETLSELENTEFFEKLAQSAPGRRDIVAELMDYHLGEYAERKTEVSKKNRSEIPADFDISDIVEQLK